MLQLTPEEAKAIWETGLKDPVFFARTVLREWFPNEVCWFHRGLFAIMRKQCSFLEKYGELDKIIAHFTYKENPADPNSKDIPIFQYVDGKLTMYLGKNVNCIIPRGMSKTTITNACTVMDIVYQDIQFALLLSESGPHAESQLSSIKIQLESNPVIQIVYGNLVPGRQDSEKWASDEFQTTTGIYVVAKGRNAQVRGMNKNGIRPDKIVLDDLEDDESVSTEDQRKKAKKFFWASVFPALRKSPNARIICLGTLLHEDALLVNLERSPMFTSLRFGIIDKDGKSLWEHNFPLKEILRLEQEYTLAGELNTFNREFFSKITAEHEQKFRNDFIYYVDRGNDGLVARALAVDPAISDKSSADFFGLGVVSMYNGGYFQVEECVLKKGLNPSEQVDLIFENWIRWLAPVSISYTGIESIAYQAALVHLVREEMFRRGVYFEVKPLTNRERKIERVEGILQKRYSAKYIGHRIQFPLLEKQLLKWPKEKKDGPDVIAMAVGLLDPMAHVAIGENFNELLKPLPRMENRNVGNGCP